MGNRQLTVTVCGMVAGVIIGAGILSVGRPASVNGNLLTQFQDMAFYAVPRNIENSRGRFIKESGLRTAPMEIPNYPTIKKDETTVEQEEEETADEAIDADACDAVTDVLDQLENIHARLVRLAQNAALRTSLQRTIRELRTDYCGEQASASASASSTRRVIRVDNDCEQYPEATARRVECEHDEEMGVAY